MIDPPGCKGECKRGARDIGRMQTGYMVEQYSSLISSKREGLDPLPPPPTHPRPSPMRDVGPELKGTTCRT